MDTEGPGKPEHEAEGYALIGACFEVYKALGNGYLEDVDQKSLEIELGDQGIPFVALPRVPVFDQGRALPKRDEADRLVFARISVALKAVQALLPEPEAPLRHDLKATGRHVGYLVNFGAFPKLGWRRRVL